MIVAAIVRIMGVDGCQAEEGDSSGYSQQKGCEVYIATRFSSPLHREVVQCRLELSMGRSRLLL